MGQYLDSMPREVLMDLLILNDGEVVALGSV